MNQIDALVPRGLLNLGDKNLSLNANPEGFSHIRVQLSSGLVTNIEAVSRSSKLPNQIILPRLVEPHSHLDKTFSWGEFSNFSGNYFDALDANFSEHKTRTNLSVSKRAERALALALENGIRAIRTHVDSFGSINEPSWEALIHLKEKWSRYIELQFVALSPVEFWSTSEGRKFASDIASLGGLLGGVVLPPFNGSSFKRHLANMLSLADELGCGVDFHIDESDKYPAAGLRQLLIVLDGMNIEIPVTCSHLSSLGLLPIDQIRRFADRLAIHRVGVVALPLSNGWLLGGRRSLNPNLRPFAPIDHLQKAGVIVGVGGDNVRDAWFPGGSYDILSLMAFSLPFAQMAPWERLGLAPFTTSPANLMNLVWDGTFYEGCPASFLLIEGNSWTDVISFGVRRKVIINGVLLEEGENFTFNSPKLFD